MSNLNMEEVIEKADLINHEKPGTVFSGYTVMTKSMVGSGILSIAFACSKCGLILGILLLFFAAFLTWLSLHVICKLALDAPTGDITFYTITERILPKVKRFLDIAVIVDCLGSAIAFVQTMGTLLGKSADHMFGFESLDQRSVIMIIQTCMVIALLPVCLMKEISGTKYLNIIGLLGLVYVTILAMVYTNISEVSSDLLYPIDSFSGVSGFLIMIFAFSCQQNVLSVVTEMKSPSIRKLDMVTGSAISTGFIMYLPVMILPFLTFGRSKDDASTFFELLPPTIATQIGYVCAALSVSISFVLVVHPIRRSVLSLMYSGELPTGRKEKVARTGVVLAILTISLGVAIAAGSSLGPTLEFTALLGANTCGFLMPCILYLKHFGFDFKIVALLLFSIALYPIGITAAIMGIIKS